MRPQHPEFCSDVSGAQSVLPYTSPHLASLWVFCVNQTLSQQIKLLKAVTLIQ